MGFVLKRVGFTNAVEIEEDFEQRVAVQAAPGGREEQSSFIRVRGREGKTIRLFRDFADERSEFREDNESVVFE